MCNLYNITTTQRGILEWSRAMRDQAGNLQPALDIFSDNPAPVVRKGADGERELVRLRWGMPTPPERMKATRIAARPTSVIRWLPSAPLRRRFLIL